MLEILMLYSLVVILRIVPKFLNNKINSDTWYHIVCADNIRKNKHGIPKNLEGYLLPSGYNYPFFYHFLLSVVPTQTIIKYERMISGLFDGVLIVISYVMFGQVLGDSVLALELSILLAFSPTLLKVSTGPRAYDLTPRVFSELTTLIYFLAMYQFYLSSDYLFYLVALFFGAVSFLTNKFSIQVIPIFCLFMGTYLGSISILVSPLYVFVLTIILSNDRYFKAVKQHFIHLYKYATELKNQDSFCVKHFNSICQYKQFFRSLITLKLKAAYRILHANLVYFNFAYKDFEFFILLALVSVGGLSYLDGATSNDSYLVAWLISGILTFVITGTYSFKFIGEADRYLEYAIFPLYIFLSVVLEEYFILFLVIFILSYLYNIYIFSRSKGVILHDLYNATKFIKNNYNCNDYKLLGLISHSSFYQGKLLTGLDTMVSSASEFSKTNWKNNLWDKYYKPEYPVRTNDFEWMQQEFGVNIILAYQPYIESVMQSHNHEYNFGEYSEAYNKNNFVVYEKI